MRFTHICLENWRNFSAADIALQQRCFLWGPNAAGKSNFLDAFRFLQDLTLPGGGFQEAVGARSGISKIRCLSAKQRTDISFHVKVREEARPDSWEYQLQFNQKGKAQPAIISEVVLHNEDVLLRRPVEEDRDDPEQLTQTYLEQVKSNKDFRPLVNFFQSIRYLHIVPQLLREPDRYVRPDRYLRKEHDPFGGDFLEQIAQTQKKTRDARMKRIAKALRIAVPQLKELDLERDAGGKPHLKGRYEHWRPHGAWQFEDQFSDGTLRLFGLLWAVLDGDGPILLEEPELSLHPEVVRYIPQMLARLARKSGRQVFVSTHSKDLLADRGIALDEIVLLEPGSNGTQVRLARDDEAIAKYHQFGSSIADMIAAQTAPKAASQLPLFPDIP